MNRTKIRIVTCTIDGIECVSHGLLLGGKVSLLQGALEGYGASEDELGWYIYE